MYIKILLNYILGYVNILVEGFFTERFINTCINKNIFLFNIKRDKSTIIYANVGIFDFKNVVKIAKQSKDVIWEEILNGFQSDYINGKTYR